MLKKISEQRFLTLLLGALLPMVFWCRGVAPHLLMLLHWWLFFRSTREFGPRKVGQWWFVGSLAFYGLGMWWLGNIFQWKAVLLIMILGLFHYFLGLVVGWGQQRLRGLTLALFLACAATAVEYYRGEWFSLRYPWFTAGMAIGPALLSPLLGIYAVSFCVILSAASLIYDHGRRAWLLGGGMALLAAFPCVDWGQGGRDGPAVPVLAVQSEAGNFKDIFQMTSGRPFRDGIILWPEYAVQSDIRKMFSPGLKLPKVLENLQDLARERNSLIILGGSRRSDTTQQWNEAVTLDATGILGTHEKNRPVHLMADGRPSERAESIATPLGRIGTPICFDNDYTDVDRRIAAHGAEVFLCPSMDAASWSAQQHLQHGRLFQCRAAETGKWFLVAATSGLTQLISPTGKVLARAELLEPGFLEGAVHFRSGQTFYVRYGWVFPWVMVGISGPWLLALLFVKRRKNEAVA